MTGPHGGETNGRPGFFRADADVVGPDLPPLPTLRPLLSFRRLGEPPAAPDRSAGPSRTNGHQPSTTPIPGGPFASVDHDAVAPPVLADHEPADMVGPEPEATAAEVRVDCDDEPTTDPGQAEVTPAGPVAQAAADAAVSEFGLEYASESTDEAVVEPPAPDTTKHEAPPKTSLGDEPLDQIVDREPAPLAQGAERAEGIGSGMSDGMSPPGEPGSARRHRFRDDPDETTEIPGEQIANLVAAGPTPAGRHSTAPIVSTVPTVAINQESPADPDRSRPRRVLVVGAGPTGAAVAAALAASGLQIAISDAPEGGSGSGTDVIATLPGGRHHVFVAGDYTDPAGVSRILQDVVDGLGGLDVVVYTAAAPVQVAADGSAQEWADAYGSLLTVNLLGAATVVQGASRLFRNLGVRGRIVLVAAGGSGTSPGMDRSVAQGLIGLGTGLAEELAAQGVEVTVVSELRRSSTGTDSVALPEPSPLAGTVSWLVTRPSETPAPAHIALSG